MSSKEVTIADVAKYILETKIKMTTMKLQKLCFYIHAWYMVENSDPLFSQTFEAWANGPVSPYLYSYHRQMYSVELNSFSGGDSAALTKEHKTFVNAVLDAYHPLSASQLSVLSHSETPWIDARNGLPDGAPSNNQIDNNLIRDFYKRLNKSKSIDVRDIVWPQWLDPATK